MTTDADTVFVIRRTGHERDQGVIRITTRYLGVKADGDIEWFTELKPAIMHGGLDVVEPGVLIYRRTRAADNVLRTFTTALAATGVQDRLEIVALDAGQYAPSFGSLAGGFGTAP